MFIPEYVGPQIKDEPYGHIFRAYYVDTAQFHLLGNSYEVQPIVEEIFTLHEKVKECLSNGRKLPRRNG